MESQKQFRNEPSPNVGGSETFESRLVDAILSHLNLLSENGKEKVLDYISALIDLEQKKREFERRQGRLYNWVTSEEQKI